MLPIIIQEKIDDSKLEWLQEVWEIFTYRFSVPKNNAAQIFETIKKLHSEEHRSYHNLSHIYSLLMLMEQFDDFILNHELVELSIWFHDLIYSPNQTDNEKQSAQRAQELLTPYVPPEFLNQLNYMILSTEKHSPMLTHHDNKIFLDFDMAVLASEKEVYDKYAKAIRREFSIFSDEIYSAGRRKVLEDFLAKKNIYYSQFFKDNYEEKARVNIESELLSI